MCSFLILESRFEKWYCQAMLHPLQFSRVAGVSLNPILTVAGVARLLLLKAKEGVNIDLQWVKCRKLIPEIPSSCLSLTTEYWSLCWLQWRCNVLVRQNLSKKYSEICFVKHWRLFHSYSYIYSFSFRITIWASLITIWKSPCARLTVYANLQKWLHQPRNTIFFSNFSRWNVCFGKTFVGTDPKDFC